MALSAGAGVKMEHFQAALDPRKQELLEARFLGAKLIMQSEAVFRAWRVQKLADHVRRDWLMINFYNIGQLQDLNFEATATRYCSVAVSR
ncbi:hypothetical protein EVAR_80489_1 [Eumeta japonica]|uniref:Uncharacterized protein n=1 Tax=Eumeta variegata TaxID=151549 RepID=A0A4C1ZDQ2_EUMVA|nr:hypothetical protein EVAR_80489_1 [Eumeta japonica]